MKSRIHTVGSWLRSILVSELMILATSVKNCPKKMYISCRPIHITYSRNNMGQKCEGNCGLWVLIEIINKIYHENLKKIVGAVWELPAK